MTDIKSLFLAEAHYLVEYCGYGRREAVAEIAKQLHVFTDDMAIDLLVEDLDVYQTELESAN